MLHGGWLTSRDRSLRDLDTEKKKKKKFPTLNHVKAVKFLIHFFELYLKKKLLNQYKIDEYKNNHF